MKYIFDASAIIALAKGEKGDDVVEKLLRLRGSCCIHPVNWIEIHYKVRKWNGEEWADATTEFLHRAGVALLDIGGDDFRRRISTIKHSYPDLSLADCHAIALAEWLGGTVVTSDKRMSDASDIAVIKQIR